MRKGGEWISAPEAGRMLQVHPQTIKAWVARGFLVGYQPYPKAHNLISLASVEQMLEARRRALQKLKHQVAEGMADSRDGSKIQSNFDESAESGNAVDEQPHKHPAIFWRVQTALTAVTA